MTMPGIAMGMSAAWAEVNKMALRLDAKSKRFMIFSPRTAKNAGMHAKRQGVCKSLTDKDITEDQ
jgi:hypothetical protein